MNKVTTIEEFLTWLRTQTPTNMFGGLHTDCPLAQYTGGAVGMISYVHDGKIEDLPRWARKFVSGWPWPGGNVQQAIDVAEYIKKELEGA